MKVLQAAKVKEKQMAKAIEEQKEDETGFEEKIGEYCESEEEGNQSSLYGSRSKFFKIMKK